MAMGERLLNYQRTFNELKGECFTAAFQKAYLTVYTSQKTFEKFNKISSKKYLSKSATEIIEQDMKYVQN